MHSLLLLYSVNPFANDYFCRCPRCRTHIHPPTTSVCTQFHSNFFLLTFLLLLSIALICPLTFLHQSTFTNTFITKAALLDALVAALTVCYFPYSLMITCSLYPTISLLPLVTCTHIYTTICRYGTRS